jgi:hypothetical protein
MLTGQIGPTIKIILSVQDNLCQTFATVRRTIGMTGIKLILSGYRWFQLFYIDFVELFYFLNQIIPNIYRISCEWRYNGTDVCLLGTVDP